MEKPPLTEIFGSYTAWKADDSTWFIQFMNGSQYMYLLEGKEKALLLDTGYGSGNLRTFVERLTTKPIIVANTHFHPDHAGGNGEFQEVLMSKGEVWDEPSVTTLGAVPFNLSQLPYPNYKRTYLKEGDQIDLGERTIEVLETKPAHCNSSLFFLDKTHRMLFCGDEMESAQVILIDNSKNPKASYDVHDRLIAFRSNCLQLKELSPEYDWLLPNHNGTPMAKSYIDDYIGLVDAIYEGTARIEDNLHHKFIEMDPRASQMCRIRFEKASIIILKKQVMKIYGKKSL